MKIIALQGCGGIGKTTTLKKVIGEMLAKKVPCIDHGVFGGPKSLQTASLPVQLASKHDVWAIFDDNGKKIAITSRGDVDNLIKEALNLSSLYNCEIFVCAVRSSGGTVAFVKKQATDHYIFHQISVETNDAAKRAALRDEANKAMAQNLLHWIYTV